MDPSYFTDIAQEGIFVLLKIAAPVMLTGLIIGLIISLFQALTQIQEATLTFVPKILAIFVVLIFTMPYMVHTLTDYTMRIGEKIVGIE